MARLLVIEDNPDNLELMTYLLKAFGHEITTARDGAEGIAAAQRDLPDLIVCDIHLPNVSGYEVALQLKQNPRLRPIPLIAVTALAMVGDRDKVLAAGFDGYLPKPIVPETFVGQVEVFLAPGQRLPKPAIAPAADTTAKASLPTRTRARILVVDNSSINLSLMTSTLEPFGYHVILCHTAAEAMATAQSMRPDLIISDLHMPGHDGFDLIKLVKANPALQSIPFVFLSSTVWEDEDKRTGLGLGAVKFIQRPIEPQELLRQIEVSLEPVSSKLDARSSTPGSRQAEVDHGDDTDR
jgi:two-component system cell cycle response regulator